mmetsp:Transcript_4515/g.7595  ORF Transcript_4515/g.7595 Transcript_4515/m.7595 type:complete len:363 (-) Transcript_4515:197-1285(-)
MTTNAEQGTKKLVKVLVLLSCLMIAASCPDGTQPSTAGSHCIPCPADQVSEQGLACRSCTSPYVPNHNQTKCTREEACSACEDLQDAISSGAPLSDPQRECWQQCQEQNAHEANVVFQILGIVIGALSVLAACACHTANTSPAWVRILHCIFGWKRLYKKPILRHYYFKCSSHEYHWILKIEMQNPQAKRTWCKQHYRIEGEEPAPSGTLFGRTNPNPSVVVQTYPGFQFSCLGPSNLPWEPKKRTELLQGKKITFLRNGGKITKVQVAFKYSFSFEGLQWPEPRLNMTKFNLTYRETGPKGGPRCREVPIQQGEHHNFDMFVTTGDGAIHEMYLCTLLDPAEGTKAHLVIHDDITVTVDID